MQRKWREENSVIGSEETLKDEISVRQCHAVLSRVIELMDEKRVRTIEVRSPAL